MRFSFASLCSVHVHNRSVMSGMQHSLSLKQMIIIHIHIEIRSVNEQRQLPKVGQWQPAWAAFSDLSIIYEDISQEKKNSISINHDAQLHRATHHIE